MAVLGAIPGIGLAIVIAVIEFLWDGWRPHSAVLGRAEGVKGYHDITRYPDARQIPGLVLFRWDAPLFFANAELFKERVLDAAATSPTPVRWLVVAAEPVTSVDVTAADMLAELDETLHAAGHRVVLRRAQGPRQGQAEAIRTVRAVRRRSLLSDHRRRGQRLSREPRRRIGWIGRSGLKRAPQDRKQRRLSSPRSKASTLRMRSVGWLGFYASLPGHSAYPEVILNDGADGAALEGA